MNNSLVLDLLYDFAISLTYETHESGTVDYVKYIDSYCENQEIDENLFKKIFQDYCNYYLRGNNSWFPDREDVEDWYTNYRKVKV